jgi:hypothetical protein
MAGTLLPRNQLSPTGSLRSAFNTALSLVLVLLVSVLIQGPDNNSRNLLLGYVVALLLAVRLCGPQRALPAIGLAMLMAAYVLPPSNSFAIIAPLRVSYGLFVVFCVLISCYRPSRYPLPPLPKSQARLSQEEMYTEASLPSVATTAEEQVAKQRQILAGDEVYQWLRTQAHLSDLLWDVQVHLQQGDMSTAYMLVQHTYQTVASLRQHSLDLLKQSGETQDAKKIDTGIPLTRTSASGLPALDSLVRASEESRQEQQSVLLQAATEGGETPPEQLVRTAGEPQE